MDDGETLPGLSTCLRAELVTWFIFEVERKLEMISDYSQLVKLTPWLNSELRERQKKNPWFIFEASLVEEQAFSPTVLSSIQSATARSGSSRLLSSGIFTFSYLRTL